MSKVRGSSAPPPSAKGKFEVKDLPEVWNSRFQEYLGITPKNDAQARRSGIWCRNSSMRAMPSSSFNLSRYFHVPDNEQHQGSAR